MLVLNTKLLLKFTGYRVQSMTEAVHSSIAKPQRRAMKMLNKPYEIVKTC